MKSGIHLIVVKKFRKTLTSKILYIGLGLISPLRKIRLHLGESAPQANGRSHLKADVGKIVLHRLHTIIIELQAWISNRTVTW